MKKCKLLFGLLCFPLLLQGKGIYEMPFTLKDHDLKGPVKSTRQFIYALDKYETIYFDRQGLITKKEHDYRNDSLTMTETYKWDKNKRIAEWRINYQEDGAKEPYLTLKIIPEYDKKGNLVKLDYIQLYNAADYDEKLPLQVYEEKPFGTVTFTYDENNFLIKREEQSDYSDSTIEIVNDERGNAIDITSVSHQKGTGYNTTSTGRTQFVYDEKNEMTRLSNLDYKSGVVSSLTDVSYEYDSKGNITKKTNRLANNPWTSRETVETTSTDFFYDRYGNCIRYVETRANGEKQTFETQYEYY